MMDQQRIIDTIVNTNYDCWKLDGDRTIISLTSNPAGEGPLIRIVEDTDGDYTIQCEWIPTWNTKIPSTCAQLKSWFEGVLTKLVS